MGKKLAVIIPGIGYHKDKPLLYYASKLAASAGYEVLHIGFHDMPQKIRGDEGMMRQAAELAVTQTEEQLAGVDFDAYESVLFIGKSIGTIAAAKAVQNHSLSALQIWYTPVEATFSFGTREAVAFIGEADPWSDVAAVCKMAEDAGIPIFTYPACNHSLECTDVLKNIEILRDVMEKTSVRL